MYDEVGKGMGAGRAGKETEKLIVSRQTIAKGQHKTEMQCSELKCNCTSTQYNIQTQKLGQKYLSHVQKCSAPPQLPRRSCQVNAHLLCKRIKNNTICYCPQSVFNQLSLFIAPFPFPLYLHLLCYSSSTCLCLWPNYYL